MDWKDEGLQPRLAHFHTRLYEDKIALCQERRVKSANLWIPEVKLE